MVIFEQIHRSLSRDLKDERKSGEFKATISNLANMYWSSYKSTQNTLRKHGILKKTENQERHCNSQTRQRKCICKPG